MIIKVSLVTICHYTKLLQYYWLFSLCVYYSLMTFILYLKSVSLNPLHLFTKSPTPLPLTFLLAATSFFSVAMSLLLFRFASSFALFLRFYKEVKSYSIWHSLYNFFHLAYYRLSIYCHKVRILFFFLYVTFHCIYVPHVLHPSTYQWILVSLPICKYLRWT